MQASLGAAALADGAVPRMVSAVTPAHAEAKYLARERDKVPPRNDQEWSQGNLQGSFSDKSTYKASWLSCCT
ncbi:hypothetical protein GCM10010423_32450 [Streptomyces levis]|uniref:Uncharacterized protein n=1 Tax=Streptomyces levis TaxID=285566 RepID=A0ABN3NTB2_9ACTN